MAADASDASPDGSSWAKAYPSLQQALGAATAGTEIWIKTGTYKPTPGNDRNASFRLKSNLTIRGGFRGDETTTQARTPWGNPVVLSGDIGTAMVGAITATNENPPVPASAKDEGWKDNSYNVLVGDGVENVTLEFLTVTGGSANSESMDQADIDGFEMYADVPGATGARSAVKPSSTVVGGGLFFNTGPAWTVTRYGLQMFNCRFARNMSRGYGGAVGLYDGSAYIGGCEFEENVSEGPGGAFWGLNQQSGFVQCSFTSNTSADGGGAVKIMGIPSERASNADVDGFSDALRGVAFSIFGVEDETATRNRVGSLLTAYGVYKASNKFMATEGGFFTKFAATIPNPFKKATTQVGGATVTNTSISPGTRVLAAYAVIQLGFSAADGIVKVLDAFGKLDKDSADYKRWVAVNDGFNRYATPQGLLSLATHAILNAALPEVSPDLIGTKKANFKNYTQAGRSAFASCTFTGNQAANEGGAIELVFNNLLVESCTFTKNRSESNGGAISSAMWNMPQVISSVFTNNSSTDGTSAISNSFNSIMMMVNCTVINNKSDAALGVALSATMGADVRIYNSILWNNANKSQATGADVEAVTESMLEENARARFNALQGEQVNWLGIMDIRNSIVQSLNTIPLGKDRIAPQLAGSNLSQATINAAIAATQAADARGELESTGAVNVGEGVRPKLRDPSYGNSAADPMLLSSPTGKPSVQSPANNAGNNQWIDWKMIFHAVAPENIMDVAGKKRIQNSRVDIGAYEVDSARPDSSPLAGTNVDAGAGNTDNREVSGGGVLSASVINGTTTAGVRVYYVKPTASGDGSGSSWANATGDLGGAVSHANAEVWVAAGTYRPTSGSDRNASFSLAGGVRVFGGFAGNETERAKRDWKTNVTTISGDIGTGNVSTDNSKNLFKNVGVSAGSLAVLDGFTFREAYSTDADGGAILNVDSAPLIRNCVFLNNHARNGGAIHSSGSISDGSILIDCEFLGNSAEAAGGAVAYARQSLFGHDLIFDVNTAGTSGGAISVTGNAAGQYCTVQNGLFSSNSSSEGTGGAISSSGVLLTVVNTTFYGNRATITSSVKAGGGAIDDGSSDPQKSAQIFNSIFYKNSTVNLGGGGRQTVEKQQIQSTVPLVRNSLIQGLSTYGGGAINANFSGDPLFVAEGTDFRLQKTSLAVDAGDSSSVYVETIALDLSGKDRVVNGKIDLGPYEREVTPAHPVTNVGKTSAGTDSHTFTASYTAVAGDTLRWYVDRGDGLGYVALTESEENKGVSTNTLTITSRPTGFSYRLQVTHDGVVYFSPEAILAPTAASIFRYVYVKPVATGDGSGSSWTNATSDLKAAVGKESAEVWVAAGVYKPTSGTDRDSSFAMGAGVKVYGGFSGNETKLEARDWRANRTIISGEIGGAGSADNSRHLFRNTDVNNSAVLDGFHFRDAHAEGSDGGAILNVRSNPAIRNCVFEGNHARRGGAIFSLDTSAVSGFGSKVFNCEFLGNSAESEGGAIFFDGSWAGANLIFKNNTAPAGGAIHSTGDTDGQNGTVQNSLFVGNRATAGSGGAIHAIGVYFNVINSTFYGNQAKLDSTAAAAGGAAYFDRISSGTSSLTFHNSIFYKNTALNSGTGGRASTEKQQIYLTAGSLGGGKNSLIQGLQSFSGNGNFDGDPVFVNEGTDFHVSNTSLTIESGTMDQISSRLEMTDLDGNSRIVGTIDLGPYEHAAATANPIRRIIASSSGLENHSYTVADYAPLESDALAWQVDRGDGLGFVILGANDPDAGHLPDAYLGLDSPSLNILTPPSGLLFRLKLVRNGVTYYSAASRLTPTELSKSVYVYVRPVATGDGSGTGWANATSDLHAAMAKPNAQVWVQEGTYYPTSGTDRNASFSLTAQAVKVYGGFKGNESLRDARDPKVRVTRISGNIGSPADTQDNSRHLFRNENVGPSTILDGLTFENAWSDDADGGAILNISSSPTIQNCVFLNNHARNGGAIASTGTPSDLFGSDLVSNRFENNTAVLGGGAISYNSSAVFENNVFKGNRAGSGGAVTLSGNSRGLSFTVKNGLFHDNRALDGRGGAISSEGISLRFINSTFHGNQAESGSSSPLGGGAVHQGHTIPGAYTVELYNSIFHGNSVVNTGSGGLAALEDQQILINGGGSAFASHSLIEGLNRSANIPELRNFDENPGFVDAANGNFRLSSTSPAINSGTASYGGGYLLTATDLEGNSRVGAGAVDLGPYEYAGPAALGRIVSSSDFSSETLKFIKSTSFTPEEGDVLLWYVDRGDGNYVPLSEDGIFTGVNTRTLTIIAPPASANGYLFRLQVVRGGNTLTTTSTRLALPPARIYVDAARLNMSADGLSWESAYGSLADALKASGPGTELWVAGGTYLPTGGTNTEAAFEIPSGVRIYGGFLSFTNSLSGRNPVTRPTILSGRLNGAADRDSYSRHVVVNRGTNRKGLLDGFIIENSYSGLMLNDGASPTIRNCVFRDNDSSRAGDGYGAAISNINGANPLIAECQFLGNTGVYSGALYIADSSATVENSVFARNTASAVGGAIFVNKGTLDMVHCTVADNTSKGTAAALYTQDSTVTVSNSIFWNNRTNYQGWTTYERAIQEVGGSLVFRFSCVEGGESLGASNVKFDPIFDPARGGDHALALFSPLVNAGSADHVVSSGKDLVGNTRIRETAPDMGAYELAANSTPPVRLISLPRSRTAYNIDGSVDFTVSWPEGTTLVPVWSLSKDGVGLNPGRYTLISGNGFSTVRLNNISLLDSGLKVTFSDVDRQVYSIPPAILTVKEPRILRVNPTATGTNDGSSWLNACTSLTRALENAEASDEIWVTGGVHTPGSTASNFNLNGSVNLFGGFAGIETARADRDPAAYPTILHAKGTNLILYGGTPDADSGLSSTIDGFIIENSTGPAAVYHAGVTITYRNCVFRNNAGYIGNFQSQVQYDNCEFTANTGNLFIIDRSTVTFGDSRIHDNTTSLDLINTSNGSTVLMSDAVVTGNTVAGAFFRNGNGVNSTLTVLRSVFRENSTGGAVIANNATGTCVIEGSLFARNTSGGMATLQNSGNLTMTFCTVADNRGGSFGGGLFNYRLASSTIKNCIFWGNRGSRITSTPEQHQMGDPAGTDGMGVSTVTRSIIESVPTALSAYDPETNMSFYPLFVDPSAGDYHLSPNSPAAATSSSANMTLLSTTDLDKVQRRLFYGAAGAYESPANSGDPLLISNYPTSVTTTEMTDASFSYTGRDFQHWQYLDGDGNWVNITGDTSDYRLIRSSDGFTRTLYFDSPSLALDGSRFRLVISRTSDGVTQTINSGELLLTVRQPQVIHVDGGAVAFGDGKSWATAFNTIQQALSATNEYSEIWVRAGGYVINGANLRWNVRLYGGFAGNETTRNQRNVAANEVVLLGGGKQIFTSNDSASARALKISDAVLDGFTLTGVGSGSALGLHNSDSTISNCIFRGNANGINVADVSNPVISNCVFDSGISALVLDGDSATISGCSFLNNAGGSNTTVYIFRGKVGITDSTFSGNTSSNAVVYALSDYPATTLSNVISGKATQLTMSRCRMTGNTAYAGIQTNLALLNLDNSVIARNTVYTMAVRGYSQSVLNLTNVTIADNNGSIECAGVANDANLNLKNSIIWGNRTSWPYAAALNPGSLSLMENSQVKLNSKTFISNSIVEGAHVISGNGNSGYDPFFTDAAALDYQIQAFSPAVNKGSSSGIPAGTLDLASQPRTQGSAPDIGAYEFTGAAASPIQVSSNHGARTVVVGQQIRYSVQVPAGVDVQWQVESGGSFANVVAGTALALSDNGATMTLTDVPLSLTGTRFRFVLSGNASYTSPAGALTVVPKQVLFVDASATGNNDGSTWANAFTSVNDALRAGSDPIYGGPRQIWVARGTYVTEGALSPGVDMFGGFRGVEGMLADRSIAENPTILTNTVPAGQVLASRMLSTGVYANSQTIRSTIDGFTLTGSTGGIGVFDAPLLVKNCTFSQMAGMGIIVSKGPLTVEGCVFDQMTGLGVVTGPWSTATIRHSVFQAGADNAVQSTADSTLNIEDSVFRDHNPTNPQDSVVYVSIGSTTNIVRSQFTGNHNDSVINNDGRIFIRQSLLADNSGGGVSTTPRAEATRLTSCTLANNGNWGISIGWQNQSLRLSNCIIAGNKFRQQIYTDSGGVFASHTLVQGEPHGGTGNMSWDPLFTDVSSADYTLSARSPAVNAGDVSALESGETDVTGGTRIKSGGLDLGAFESAHVPDPLYRSALPESIATVRGVDGVFSITGDPGYAYTWQYRDGSDWVTITYNSVTGLWEGPAGVPVTINTVNGVSKLTFTSPSLGANGIKVRVTIDGQGVTSDELTLTVNEPETMYVDASVAASGDGKTWTSAFKTLDEALWENPTRLNPARRIVKIAKGTYTAPANGFQISQRIEIYGGYPTGGEAFGSRNAVVNPVILNGERGDPASTADNAVQVLDISALNAPIAADAVFDGFTVTNGKAGIKVRDNASPTLRDLVVSRNAGTGLAITSGGGRVTNCHFLENSSTGHGGGALTSGAMVTFSACSFRGNTAGNAGGGLYLFNGVVRLENCVVSGNTSVSDGGGINSDGGNHSFVNGVVVGNRTDSYAGGGGLYAYQGSMAVSNSIVRANRSQLNPHTTIQQTIEAQQLNVSVFGGSFNVRSSNLEGLATRTGAGNLDVDPLFYTGTAAADAPTIAGDFHLQGGSPMADKGDDSLLDGLSVDADGAPRVVRTVDIGPYEFGGAAITSQPADLVYSTSGQNQYQVQLAGSDPGDVFQWETSANGVVFSPVSDGVEFSGSQSETLQLLTGNPTRNGNFFRVRITSSGGSVVVSRNALLTVYASRYHVDASASDDNGDGYTWATAFKTIGTALAKARIQPGGEIQIWVAGGTYQPSAVDTAISYPLKSGIALYGGFAGTETTLAERVIAAHPTTLQGIAGTTAVFSSTGTQPITGVRIDGFAINTAVSGIAPGKNVTLTVANCSFTGLENGIRGDMDTLTVRNCRFTGMTSYGIYALSGPLDAVDTVFEGNRQGVVLVDGSLNMVRSVFRGNGASTLDGGAVSVFTTPALFENCLFSGNYGRNGGAVRGQGGNVVFRNTTLAGNYATVSGGGVYYSRFNNAGNLSITNSILWGNANSTSGTNIYGQIENFAPSPTYLNNNIQGGLVNGFTAGNGNLSTDPLFLAPVAAAAATNTTGDYRLSTSSPLVNKGSNGQLGSSVTDLVGNPRTFDTAVDMGAYELQVVQLAILTQPTDAVAGFGRPASFSVTTNHADATYRWQADLNGSWTDLVESADNSGVATATLTVAGNPAFSGRRYRVHVTTSDSGELFSSAATYNYVSVVVTPPTGVRNATMTGATSTITFNVAGGALPASIVDDSFAIHAFQTGRLSLSDGSLSGLTVTGNTVTMQSTVPFKPGEAVEVTTTSNVQRTDGFNAQPLVYQFRAGNRGSYGIFPNPTAIAGAPATARVVASGDLDGNGSIDFVVGGSNGATVWSNSGAASFTAAQTLGGDDIHQVILGSLGMTGLADSKNKLDVILRKDSGEVEIWRNEGNGTFTKSFTISGSVPAPLTLGRLNNNWNGDDSMVLADLNGDGSLDLFIATAAADQVWFNNGDGTFTDSGQRLGTGSGLSATVGDFNNDNSLDIATANGGNIELWSNNGAGQFSAAASISNATVNRVIASDVDLDGRLDIVSVLTTGSLRIFKQHTNSSFSFTALTSGLYGGNDGVLKVGDVDGNGIPDLITSDGSASVKLWSGQGYDGFFDRMNFQQVGDQPVFPLVKSTDLADLNGDGTMDLITIDSGGHPTVSLYRTGSAPATPSSLVVKAVTDTTISLGWNDNATNESGYSVERSPNGSNSWAQIASLPANTNVFTDTGRSPSTRYYYRVRCDLDGIFQSGYSNVANIQTNAPTPDITVTRVNGTELSSGSVVEYGNVAPGARSVVSFTIGNIGSANLTNLRLQMVDWEYYDFEFSALTTTTLAKNQTTTITVAFNAWSHGPRRTILRIYSNDPDEIPFTVQLRGTSNDAPTFGGYTATVPHDTTVPLSLAKILANASDVNGDTLSFTSPTSTVNGGTLVRTNTAISYTPPSGFSGVDSFTITVSDAYGSSVAGTVTLNVAAATPDNPLATNPNPPKLTVVPGGDIKLTFQGLPNRAYDIERSVNLGAWEVIATRTTSNIGRIEFTDENPPAGSGFYRIKKH